MRVGPGLLYILVVLTALYTLIGVPFLGQYGLNWVSIIVYGVVVATFIRAFTQSRG